MRAKWWSVTVCSRREKVIMLESPQCLLNRGVSPIRRARPGIAVGLGGRMANWCRSPQTSVVRRLWRLNSAISTFMEADDRSVPWKSPDLVARLGDGLFAISVSGIRGKPVEEGLGSSPADRFPGRWCSAPTFATDRSPNLRRIREQPRKIWRDEVARL